MGWVKLVGIEWVLSPEISIKNKVLVSNKVLIFIKRELKTVEFHFEF